MEIYDTIIIGSGLGGLTCGATLAKEGKKVLILEQHNLIGGCATCFKRKGMLVDAGLHELDWGSKWTDMKHHIFRQLGLLEKITLIPLPTAWSIKESHTPHLQITIPHSKSKEALIAMFPHEAKGIKKYFRKMKFQAYFNRRFPFDMSFFDFFFAPFTTLWLFGLSALRNRNVGYMLDSMITDSKLKRILNINITYYHHDPYKFDWNYHAVAQANYYHQGMYVKGGSQELSNALASIITDHGGEVKINADVVRILLDEKSKAKRANGVIYKDKKGQEHIIFGEKIIANCDPNIVYKELLKDLAPSEYALDSRRVEKFSTKTSLLSVYMIFDTNLSKQYPNMDYSTFIVDSDNFAKTFNKDTMNQFETSLEKRDFVFVNYSKIESGLSERDDRFFGVMTTLSSYEEWDNLSEEAYKAKKQVIKKAFETRLEEMFPHIMSYCIHSELATPKTIKRYIRTSNGTPYGYDQSFEGFWGRGRYNSKAIQNLYFASAFGFPGSGFTGAMLSGYRTAKKILNPHFYAKRLSLCVLFGAGVSLAIIECVKLLS
ncbi:phytoene desaturase family protein [Helicobacter didelphidarum]|nr:NAD(P)/FAD-dependent oxidoreductase [Helicobacter didelphidarum]